MSHQLVSGALIKFPIFEKSFSVAFLFCLAASVLFVLPGVVFAQRISEEDDRFLDQMVRMKMFNAAQWYCDGKLQDSQVSKGRKSQLAASLIRLRTIEATGGPLSQLEVRIKGVKKLASKLETMTRTFPRKELVHLQRSVMGIEYARALTLITRESTGGTEAREKGLEALSDSLLDLNLLAKKLADLKATAPNKFSEAQRYERFTQQQLSVLESEVAFYRLQALDVRYQMLEPSDAAARNNVAKDLLTNSQSFLSKVANKSLLWWRAQVFVLDSYRRLGQWADNETLWKSLDVNEVTSNAIGDLIASRVGGLVQQGKVKQAGNELVSLTKMANIRFPERSVPATQIQILDECTNWAILDVERAKWAIAGLKHSSASPQEKFRMQNDVVDFGTKVLARHGRYWFGRMMSDLADMDSGVGEVVSLLLLRQRIELKDIGGTKATAMQARKTYLKQKDAGKAMELARMVAGAAKQLPPEPWMMDLISEMATSFPKHANASPVHTYACVIGEKLLLQKKIPFKKFQDVCMKQLIHWPNSDSTDAMRVPFCGRLIQQGRTLDGLQLLAGGSMKNRYSQKTAMISQQVWDQMVARRPKDPKKQKEWREKAKKIANTWKQVLQDENGDWKGQWTLASKRFALLAIDAKLIGERLSSRWCREVMEIVNEQLPELDLALRSRATVVALAMEFVERRGAMKSVDLLDSDIQESDLMFLIQRLMDLVPPAGLAGADVNGPRLAKGKSACKIILKCIDLMPEDRLKAADRTGRWLLGLKAQSLLVLNNPKAAQEVAAQLTRQLPRSLYAWRLRGLSYSKSSDPGDLGEAEKTWRRIAILTRPNTDAWFEAKYYLATAMQAKGQKEQAKKMLGYLKLTKKKYWEGSVHKDALNRLYAQIGGR